MSKIDPLEQQITKARRAISSDGYPMSISELTNLYREKELIIRPEFQRFFRWSSTQKSRLVESILLGIPLPTIFVAQREDGRWELVDGLQRVSTILQLQGELIDENNQKKPPMILEATKYLPALEGRTWKSLNPATSLTEAQRLDIKRSKLDIKIIKRESSPETKYDLFQRLNNYGADLTSAEMRSALLVAVSSEFFAWIEHLSQYTNFVQSTQLSDRLIEERYDLELVVRFLILHNRPKEKLTLTALRDLPQILDDEAVALASAYPDGITEMDRVFKTTFDLIVERGSTEVFRRWDVAANEFKGPFLNSAFEIFAFGVGFHVANKTFIRSNLLDAVKQLWSRSDMKKGYATGRSTEARLVQFIPLGREITGWDS